MQAPLHSYTRDKRVEIANSSTASMGEVTVKEKSPDEDVDAEGEDDDGDYYQPVPLPPAVCEISMQPTLALTAPHADVRDTNSGATQVHYSASPINVESCNTAWEEGGHNGEEVPGSGMFQVDISVTNSMNAGHTSLCQDMDMSDDESIKSGGTATTIKVEVPPATSSSTFTSNLGGSRTHPSPWSIQHSGNTTAYASMQSRLMPPPRLPYSRPTQAGPTSYPAFSSAAGGMSKRERDELLMALIQTVDKEPTVKERLNNDWRSYNSRSAWNSGGKL